MIDHKVTVYLIKTGEARDHYAVDARAIIEFGEHTLDPESCEVRPEGLDAAPEPEAPVDPMPHVTAAKNPYKHPLHKLAEGAKVDAGVTPKKKKKKKARS